MEKKKLKEKQYPFDPHDVEDLKQVYEEMRELPPEKMMYVAGYIRAVRDIKALEQ